MLKEETSAYIEPGMYLLKEEFMPALGISTYQYKRRKEDLLEWLTEFFDYELVGTKPIYIKIISQLGAYEKMPNKGQKELTQQKKDDYNNYVIKHLPEEPIPMSKARMTKNALNDFGHKKYSHSCIEAVSKRYVGPAMEEHGIKTDQRFWCWAKTYEVLDDDVLFEWREILAKWKCTEKEVYNAFCKKQTLNNDEELVRLEGAFKAALNEFRDKYFDGVVLVPKWRIASAAEKAQKQSKE